MHLVRVYRGGDDTEGTVLLLVIAVPAEWKERAARAVALALSTANSRSPALTVDMTTYDPGAGSPAELAAPGFEPVWHRSTFPHMSHNGRTAMSRSVEASGEAHDELIRTVAAQFVHRLFPGFRSPAYLACPDDRIENAVVAAIAEAASTKDVRTEVVDLRPAPAERLHGVTARLHGFGDRGSSSGESEATLLVLKGFDLLEGKENNAPTYPFRSKFQFDQEHLWLFVGRDWQRLRRLFSNYSLPLYGAASNCTPEEWQRCEQPPPRGCNAR